MLNARQLGRKIVLQFLIIVMPITAIFLYQIFTDVQQADQVQFNLQRALLA
jgi:hypothetical protein